MQEVVNSIRRLTQPYLTTRKNDIHTEICYHYALRLLEVEPGDPTIVLPAILCHDLGWCKVPEELQHTAFGPNATNYELRRVHEVEGINLTREVLLEINYDPAKIEEILTIIDGHDSRDVAISDNDKVVKDADKLFRFDPDGFEIDVNRHRGIERVSYIQYLRDRIETWFFTSSAKRLARELLAAKV